MEKGDKAMGLRFIYGTAGTGKSEFCFNEIKNNIKNCFTIEKYIV